MLVLYGLLWFVYCCVVCIDWHVVWCVCVVFGCLLVWFVQFGLFGSCVVFRVGVLVVCCCLVC